MASGQALLRTSQRNMIRKSSALDHLLFNACRAWVLGFVPNSARQWPCRADTGDRRSPSFLSAGRRPRHTLAWFAWDHPRVAGPELPTDTADRTGEITGLDAGILDGFVCGRRDARGPLVKVSSVAKGLWFEVFEDFLRPSGGWSGRLVGGVKMGKPGGA
jgi:hypothetical protein